MSVPPSNSTSQQPPHQPNDASSAPSRIPLLTSRNLSRLVAPMTTLIPNPPPLGYPVWAFICGYPWWPAKVVEPPAAPTRAHRSRTNDHDKILVEFFHDNNHTSFVPLCCLRYFPDHKVSDLNPAKIPPRLHRACNEAQTYILTEWIFTQPPIPENKPALETGFRPVKRYRTTDQSPRRPFSTSPSPSDRRNPPTPTAAFRTVKREDYSSQNHQQHSQRHPDHVNPSHVHHTTPTEAMLRLRDDEIFKLHRLIFDIRVALPATTEAQLPQINKAFGPVCNTASDLLGRCGPVFAAVSEFLKHAEQPQPNQKVTQTQENAVLRMCRGLLSLHIAPHVIKNYGLMYILKAKELARKSETVSAEIHISLSQVAKLWESIGGEESGLTCDFETSSD